MCGIIAHVAFDDQSRITEAGLRAINELQFHRGPDSGGVFLKDNAALGIRRLSIIDLKTGDQPILSGDGRYAIVFNGEIYNHEELRNVLFQKGYSLKTRSDTEVLLYSFLEWGPSCLERLNGMFAFAVWDAQKKELFVARDRLGIKPLYYAADAKRILFSSELTPIYRSHFFPLKFSHRALSDYLAYWYICEPKTIFENVFQLPPGHYAIVAGGGMKVFPYWEMPREESQGISFNDAAERLTALLEDSIKLRMKVDVPIGTFLSGGVDSGLVTTIAAKYINERLKAFVIGFKERSYSEIPEALRTAGRHGIQVHPFELEDVTPQMLEPVFRAFDEPLGNASFVPTYFLAKRAREEVKVVLTGDGGDELFGGYPTYQAPYYQAAYRRLPPFMKRFLENAVGRLPVSHSRISFDYRLKQLMKGISLPYGKAHYTWREVVSPALQRELFREEIARELNSYEPFSVMDAYFTRAKNLSVKNQLMFAEMNTFLLNDHLRKVDRMTMAHSLEARLPYLDYRIVEFAMRLPSAYKVTFFTTKKILKHIALNYLPRRVVCGKKKGLTSPIAGWISNQLKGYMNDQLKGGLMAELFKAREVERLLEEHYAKKKDNSRALWALLTLQVWSKNLKDVS